MDYGYENGFVFLRDNPVVESREAEETPTTVNPGLLLLGGSEAAQRSITPVSPTLDQIFPMSSPTRSFLDPPSTLNVTNGHSLGPSRPAIDIGVNPSMVYRGPVVVIPPSRFKPLPYATGRSGVVYDVRMRYHADPRPDAFDPHPEMPKRISEIFEELNAAGLVENPLLPTTDDPFKLIRIPIRQADPSEIALVHSTRHVEFVQSLKGVYASRDIHARYLS